MEKERKKKENNLKATPEKQEKNPGENRRKKASKKT